MTLRAILICLSLVAAVAAVYFGVVGYKTLYADAYDVRAVGGDAYNFIIAAGRGTGVVCVGIVAGLIGCMLAVLATMAQPDAGPSNGKSDAYEE